MRRPRDDYNNGWQTVVRPLLHYLFSFFFTHVHEAIDWDRPVEFLDKEMQYALAIRVHESGLPQDTVVNLQRFLELVMPLPQNLEEEYQQAIREYERRKKVPVLTQWEKMAIQKGRKEGRQEAALEIALDVLQTRFPQAPAVWRERLRAVSDPAKLQLIVRTIAGAESLAEIQQALDAAGA